MAVCLIFEGPGITEAQYDRVRNEVAPGDQPPAGAVYHVAGPTETGWCVVEVWESQEAAERFFRETLQPLFQAHGVPEAPPTVFPIHNRMSR